MEQMETDTALYGESLPRWYPLRVRGRRERSVAKMLTDMGITYYLPFLRERHRWSDRWKVVEKILFPGYLFVHIPKNRKYDILDVVGAQSFIYFNNDMACIPEEQIEGIRLMLEKPESLQVHDRMHLIGKKARIVKGPIAGLSGTIAQVKNNTLVFMEIEHFGKVLSVEIDENDIIEYEDQ